jgi:OFA family oxalate/formate antiporter-like MFS transporter
MTMDGSKKRWESAIFGLMIMTFTGLLYAWSVFVIPLEAEFGWTRPQTSLTFSISMAAFCVGGIMAGQALKKYAARTLMYVAAALTTAGFVLAARITTLTGLYFCYGGCCGLGVGLCYNLVLGATLQWFPEMTGLISGMLLMGFGFGGSIFASVAVALMKWFGWRTTFVLLGLGAGFVIILGSLRMRFAAPGQLKTAQSNAAVKTDHGADFTPLQMIKDPSFIAYYIWATFLCAAGLALLGNAVPFAKSMTDNLTTAALVAGLISICNGIGRLAFGYFFDTLGSRKCLLTINICFVISGAILIFAVNLSSLAVLTVGFICAGFSYGGITPLHSALIGRLYGQKNFAVNFSVITTVALVASLAGPYFAGFLYGMSGAYSSIVLMMLVFAVLALPCLFLIRGEGAPRKR